MTQETIPTWRILANYILQETEYGDVLTHEEMSDLFGLEPQTPDYYTAIRKANKSLLEQGKKLASVYRTGYEVLKPDDYTKHSTQIFKTGANRIRHAKKVMDHAPTRYMSPRARRDHYRVADRISSFSATIEGGVVEIKLLQNPSRLQFNGERVRLSTGPSIDGKVEGAQ